MAKFEDPFQDTKNIFEALISKANLDNFINIKVLTNNRQKEIGKVVKANDLVKHMTNEDVVIILNEAIFEMLEDDQKNLVADEILAGIHFDSEADKIIIEKGDIVTHSGIISKYSFETYFQCHQVIKEAYAQKKESEE
jgi:hypothetical protein